MPVYETKFSSNGDSVNFGFSIHSEKIVPKFPVTIKIGNLSTGGILSKMNSPLISGLNSPFSTGISNVSGFTANLPGSSSYTRPVSYFFQGGYINSKSTISNISVNCWYSPQEEKFVYSSYAAVNLFQKKIKLKATYAGGFFPYSENASNSWFVSSTLYPAGNHFASALGSSIEFWKICFLLSYFFYESPFGQVNNITRTEFKYSGNHFIFSLSETYNPTPFIITSSDKTLPKGIYIRSTIQYKDCIFIRSPLFLKTGFSWYLGIPEDSIEKSLKAAFGIQIKYKLLQSSITFTANNEFSSENNKNIEFLLNSISIQQNNSLSFSHISLGLNFNIQLTPGKDYSQWYPKTTSKLTLNYLQNPKISTFAEYTISNTQKKALTDKFSTGASIELNSRFISVYLKISADLNN